MTAQTTDAGSSGAGISTKAPAPAPAQAQHLGLALVVISMAQLMLVLDELIVNTAPRGRYRAGTHRDPRDDPGAARRPAGQPAARLGKASESYGHSGSPRTRRYWPDRVVCGLCLLGRHLLWMRTLSPICRCGRC